MQRLVHGDKPGACRAALPRSDVDHLSKLLYDPWPESESLCNSEVTRSPEFMTHSGAPGQTPSAAGFLIPARLQG